MPVPLVLRAYCARPIAFHRSLVPVVGGALPALLLSQAMYWGARTSDVDGWFWKTQAEWEDETGMTRREQETARRALRSAGVLEEQLLGIPARLHYRVNFEVLVSLIEANCQADKHGGKRQTGMAESAKLTKGTETTTESTSSPTPHDETEELPNEEEEAAATPGSRPLPETGGSPVVPTGEPWERARKCLNLHLNRIETTFRAPLSSTAWNELAEYLADCYRMYPEAPFHLPGFWSAALTLAEELRAKSGGPMTARRVIVGLKEATAAWGEQGARK